MGSLNDRQRKFCHKLIEGSAAGRAYEKAGYAARGHAADVNAERLLRNADISSYLNTLRKKAESESIISAQEAQEFLSRVIRTPLSKEIVGTDLLAEHQAETERSGEKIKMPCKLGAVDRLAKMLGWNEPERHEVDFKVSVGGNPVSHPNDGGD